MKKGGSGVAPYSYSGLMSDVVIRGRAGVVTLLVAISSKESSKAVGAPHPIFLTTPEAVSLLHRASSFYHSLLDAAGQPLSGYVAL